MRILLVAIGTRMPKWVEEAFSEYANRMPKHCRLELVEIAAKKRGKNADTARILRDEGIALKQAIPQGALSIALDRRGKHINTEDLAAAMQNWIDENRDVALLVGGPEGIDEACMQQAEQKWSLSMLTFAHPLVRVMVAEQMYRAWSIISNLPYHRGD